MTIRRIDVDLDMKEGTKLARLCVLELRDVIERYEFVAGHVIARDVQDQFNYLSDVIGELLADNGAGAIATAEEDAMKREENSSDGSFDNMIKERYYENMGWAA